MMRVIGNRAVWFLAFGWVSFGAAGEEGAVSGVLRGAMEGVVEVLVDGQLKGGGAFVSEEGFIITAAHLYTRVDARFEVITGEEERLSAELVAYDKGHDLALLRVKAAGGEKGFKALPVAKEIPPLGSAVYNLSMALRNRGVVMRGTVAQDGTVFTDLADSNGYMEHYFVSAMTPSLTSGGAWVNGEGEIVGVQSARLNDGKLKSGVAMVAPPGAVAELMRTRKTAATPDIGGWVWEVWTTDRHFLKTVPEGTEGLVITWLRPGGPLAKAGLKRLDTIVACDGSPVRRRVDFYRKIRAMKPGEKVRLTIREQNVEETKEVEVELENLEVLYEGGSVEKEQP